MLSTPQLQPDELITSAQTDGLHVFNLVGGVAIRVADQPMTPPLLTCPGIPDQVVKAINCFASWEGAVKVAALQDEGLLDIWIE